MISLHPSGCSPAPIGYALRPSSNREEREGGNHRNLRPGEGKATFMTYSKQGVFCCQSVLNAAWLCVAPYLFQNVEICP